MATNGEEQDGLAGVEWMRLCALMYGAWDACHSAGDPHLVPMATYPKLDVFTTSSQFVQLLLLQQTSKTDWLNRITLWIQACEISGYPTSRFISFIQVLRAAAEQEDYPTLRMALANRTAAPVRLFSSTWRRTLAMGNSRYLMADASEPI